MTQFVPRPIQEQMIGHQLDVRRNGTWAGMGTGKTGATLMALDLLQLDTPGVDLVIAPLRVAQSTWPDEVEKWDNLRSRHRVSPVIGTPEQRVRALRADASVFTINYDNLPWLVEHFADGRRWPFRCVVADESTRLKGFRTRQGTKRAKALARVAHSRTRYWTNLTGTPSPNGLKDLWGQTWFLDAGERLGRTYTAFEQRWFYPKQRNIKGTNRASGYTEMVPHEFAQEQIEDKLKDICLSVKLEGVPEPIVNTVPVILPPRARQLYAEMEREMFAQLDEFGVEAVHAAARTMKCLQIASGAVYVDDTGQWRAVHDAKFEALESVIEEGAGKPVLVSFHWKPTLARGLKAFPNSRFLDKDPQTIRDWNAGKIPILWAHPQSAGHGLSLQEGGHVICHFDQWWDLELHDQINERLGPTRQMQSGYDRPVYQHYIVAAGTCDELVMARRETKRSVQDLLIEAMMRRG